MGEAQMQVDGPGEMVPASSPTPATKPYVDEPPTDEPAPAPKPGPITGVDPLRIREKPTRSTGTKSPVRQASAEVEIAEPAARETPSPSSAKNSLRTSRREEPTGNGLRR